jgi:hypothetical protein
MNPEFLQTVALAAAARPGPLVIPWPTRGNLGGFRSFATFWEWAEAIKALGVHEAVPNFQQAKFERAQKLYVLGWLDLDLIKAGELVALSALEVALVGSYGTKLWRNRKIKIGQTKTTTRVPAPFADYLKFMVEEDGLTDAHLPCVEKYRGTVVGALTGKSQPSLAERRNDLAHGNSFERLASSGLLELVRDLIEYAYRDRIVEFNRWAANQAEIPRVADA